MSSDTEMTPTVVVATTYEDVSSARSTVRSVLSTSQVRCLVVDVDGRYRAVADERVLLLADVASLLGLSAEATTAAPTLESEQLSFYAGVAGAAVAMADGAQPVVVLGAGVLVLGDLRSVVADTGRPVVVPGTDATGVERRAATAPTHVRRDPLSGHLVHESSGSGPLLSRALYAVHTEEQVAVLRELAADWRTAPTALDAFAVVVSVTVAGAVSVLVTPWRGIAESHLDADGRLRVDGSPALAVDLTAFDAHRPWVLDARASTTPRILLSEHPALAELAEEEARARLADEAQLDGVVTSVEPPRARMDAVLRSEARRAERAGGELPELLGLGSGVEPVAWALGLVPEDDVAPVARYLAAVRMARLDLQQAFPSVPGKDTSKLARWALRSGHAESGHDSTLLLRAAETTLAAQRRPVSGAKSPRSKGVNLIGYLAGELGLGESARLMDAALRAAGVGTSTYDVSRDLESRRGASFRESEPVLRDTSLICVNGAETPSVAAQMDAVLRGTRVIGMWYWELEDFPTSHAVGLSHVDEVWAATDFMREAIAKAAGEVPVRTVTPPLPQADADPGQVPERFGIPTDRPWFLFTFDFLSRAPRKNPYGLVEAFTRAFGDRPIGERPALVIKTINADRCPDDAERLRLQIAGSSDVMLVDAYLDNHERHVLAAHCTGFVSLHKAEGLGLTIAEAMAWGKPVITTAYGGVTQFCTEENSFLVDWQRGYVEESTGPYVKGLRWAEPDLDQAAELMRVVIDDPERAAAVGERAARDIRERHSVEAAGVRMRQVLDEGEAQWRTRRAQARSRDERRPPAQPEAAGAAEALQSAFTKARRLAGAARRKVRRRAEATRGGGTSR